MAAILVAVVWPSPETDGEASEYPRQGLSCTVLDSNINARGRAPVTWLTLKIDASGRAEVTFSNNCTLPHTGGAH